MKRKLTRQQLEVLLGAALFQSALLGVWINVTGVFLAEIRTELALSVTRVSSYFTMKNIMAALLGAIIAKAFFRSNKKVFMACVAFSVTVAAMLLVGARYPVLWYLSAIVCSLTQGSSAIMVPYILDPWFKDKAGMATGIAMGASGLASAITSPLSSVLIGSIGWQKALFVLCVIIWVLSAAGLWLLFKNKPDSAGGFNEEKAVQAKSIRLKSGAEKSSFKTGVFVVCSVIFVSATALMQFTQYFSIYAKGAGYALSVGATLTSLNMIGNTAGKFLFGFLEGAIGIWNTIILAFACILAACVCYLLFPGSLMLLYIGALLYGIVYALVNVSLSRGSIAAYGAKESQNYVGLHVSINNIGGAAYAMLIGVIYDATGNFSPILGAGIVFCVLSIVSALILKRGKLQSKMLSGI